MNIYDEYTKTKLELIELQNKEKELSKLLLEEMHKDDIHKIQMPQGSISIVNRKKIKYSEKAQEELDILKARKKEVEVEDIKSGWAEIEEVQSVMFRANKPKKTNEVIKEVSF